MLRKFVLVLFGVMWKTDSRNGAALGPAYLLLAPISFLYVFWSDSSPSLVVLSQFDKPVE